jgi:xanthine dehydrogenase accessory factor
MVEKGQIIAFVGEDPVVSKIDGILRGLIHPSVLVVEGMKIGDIDPRCDIESCFTISDKALSVGGGVLEAIAYKNKTI